MGAGDRVHGVRFDAPHNYHRESREAVYAWMARWLQGAAPAPRLEERPFTPETLADLLVFHQRPMPEGAVRAEALTKNWIDAAVQQLSTTPMDVRARGLRHALGYGVAPSRSASPPSAPQSRTVVMASADPELERQLRSRGFSIRKVDYTPFDAEAAAKIPHFDTYNRTSASQRVADIVETLRASPGSALVASGDAALAGLLAAAVETGRSAVLDVDGFDTSSDAAFVDRLYMPGLRRAGDVSTAAQLAGTRLVIHNAGEKFVVAGVRARSEKLQPREIVELLRSPQTKERR